MNTRIFAAIISAISLNASALAETPAASVAWGDAPAAVQKIALKDSAGGSISVVKKEVYDKAPAWEIIYTLKGREYERVYDAAGKLLVSEVVMTYDEAPKPVQEAIKKAFGHTKVKVEEMTERGVTYFEAGADGKELLFKPDGTPTEKPKGATR